MTISMSMIQWLASGDRGTSSNTIFTHLTGIDAIGEEGWADHPHDLGDLMRCEKLLRQCPELRPHFHRMASLSPAWAALVEHWDQLVVQALKEAPNWFDGKTRAPIASARMKLIMSQASSQNHSVQ